MGLSITPRVRLTRIYKANGSAPYSIDGDTDWSNNGEKEYFRLDEPELFQVFGSGTNAAFATNNKLQVQYSLVTTDANKDPLAANQIVWSEDVDPIDLSPKALIENSVMFQLDRTNTYIRFVVSGLNTGNNDTITVRNAQLGSEDL
jgi:hypothetical protein